MRTWAEPSMCPAGWSETVTSPMRRRSRTASSPPARLPAACAAAPRSRVCRGRRRIRPRVVAVRVREDGALHRQQRVEVERAVGAVQTLRGIDDHARRSLLQRAADPVSAGTDSRERPKPSAPPPCPPSRSPGPRALPSRASCAPWGTAPLLLFHMVLDLLFEHRQLGVELRIVGRHLHHVRDQPLRREVLFDRFLEELLGPRVLRRRIEVLLPRWPRAPTARRPAARTGPASRPPPPCRSA